VASGTNETRPLSEVLGKSGWVKIMGTGESNTVRVVPIDNALKARFSIHTPKGEVAFLAGGVHEGSRWVATPEGAKRGMMDAERIYLPYAETLQQVSDFSKKLHAEFGAGSVAAKLFDGGEGVMPRTKINWRIQAEGGNAQTIANEEVLNYQLEALTTPGIDAAQAAKILSLSLTGTRQFPQSEVDAYVQAHEAFKSTVLATHFRQLVARQMTHSGSLTSAAAVARALIQADPLCQTYAEKLNELKRVAGVAKAFEKKTLTALEFNGNLGLALRDVGLVPPTRPAEPAGDRVASSR
jgi:hypothetical protein